MCMQGNTYLSVAVAYWYATDIAHDRLVEYYTRCTPAVVYAPPLLGLCCFYYTGDFVTAALVCVMNFYLVAIVLPTLFMRTDDQESWLSSVGEFDHISTTRLWGTTIDNDKAVLNEMCDDLYRNGAMLDVGDDLNQILAMLCPMLQPQLRTHTLFKYY